jgi:hypothetical protein
MKQIVNSVTVIHIMNPKSHLAMVQIVKIFVIMNSIAIISKFNKPLIGIIINFMGPEMWLWIFIFLIQLYFQKTKPLLKLRGHLNLIIKFNRVKKKFQKKLKKNCKKIKESYNIFIKRIKQSYVFFVESFRTLFNSNLKKIIIKKIFQGCY